MLRVHNFCISVDGYGAGPDQRPDEPIGTGGERLHDWMWQTRFGRHMSGQEGGSGGLDHETLVAGFTGIGATIMGRNMFGGHPGPWDAARPWNGWWGADPP